ncbi:MAG: hypothetical protein WDZ52_13515 [Pseudohongiellaceae bacterium]
MATAAERTSIIGLVVGMVGAAPGATILAELEAIFDSGVSLAEMAEAIANNPAFNGDSGLYPAFLPNAIFATNFVTDLIGDEVSAANLTLAIDAVTGLLNAGETRGAVMFAAINAVAGVATTDPDFGAAAAALLNKTEVAEYYSVTVAQSGATVADLVAVLAGVDSTAASVTTANAAIDTEIAANADLADLIANLDAAEAAKTAFLTAEATTEVAIGTAVAAADLAIDGVVAGYDAATDNVKAALLADAQTANATTLAGANTALAGAVGATAGTASVTGLVSAISTFEATITARDAAIEAAALADVDQTEAEGAYDVLNGDAVGTTVLGAGGTLAGLIVASGTTLALAAGVTEVTDPGVTALLAAAIANQGAIAAATAARTAAEDALAQVENLDPNVARDAELLNVEAGMTFVTPATAGAPTLAEMAAERAALEAGVAQLDADVTALSFDTDEATTELAHAALTTAAVAAGFISAGAKTDMDAAFDAGANGDQADVDASAVASNAVLAADNGVIDFEALVTVYEGVGHPLIDADDVSAALAETLLALAADTAAAAVAAANLAIATLAGLVDDKAEAEANVDALADLQDVIDDAEAAFAGAGFAVPVLLDSAVKAATVADDVFIEDGINSQIISFGASGDDVLFIGGGLTLNSDTTAGDEGDNAVLEVWVTASGSNTIITIEETVFGSEAAAVPETFQITLTGVAVADVVLSADGVVSLA